MSLVTFAQEVLSDFQKTAAIAPSSRYLVEAMIEPLPLSEAKVIVELGPGTGAMTRELLKLAPLDARIVAFEINPRFAGYLREALPDPRLKVIETSAENAAQELRSLGVERVDAVLSSLGLSLMQDRQVHDTLRGLLAFLGPNSVVTQYQYLQQIRFQKGKIERYQVSQILGRYFGTVDRHVIWRNIPPAFVFCCRK